MIENWTDLDRQNRNHYAKRRQPAAIIEAVKRLELSICRLSEAADLHEQAGTEITAELLQEAAKQVSSADNELLCLREMWSSHPEAFDDEGCEADREFQSHPGAP